jgi:hypothetical protein
MTFVLALAQEAVCGAEALLCVWFNCWPSFPELIRYPCEQHITSSPQDA